MGYRSEGHPLKRVATKTCGHRERVTNAIVCRKEYEEEVYKTGCQKLRTNIDVRTHVIFKFRGEMYVGKAFF